MENQYVEVGKIAYLRINDTDFDHMDAWCYPFKKFIFENIDTGPISIGDPSWVQNYIQMSENESIPGIYEQYGQEADWT